MFRLEYVEIWGFCYVLLCYFYILLYIYEIFKKEVNKFGDAYVFGLISTYSIGSIGNKGL